MSPIGDSNREFPHVIGVMGDVKSEGKRSVSIPVDDRAKIQFLHCGLPIPHNGTRRCVYAGSRGFQAV